MRSRQPLASPVFGLPRVPRTAISRPRLSQLIAGLLKENDLIVVRAPAGTGKTVALADWASSGITPGHISWVTLDESYADRRSFWREMIHGTYRRVDDQLHPMIHECSEALSAGADPQAVLRRFIPHIPETIVVIDRLDFITDEALLKDMAWVLQNSRSIKAVVTSRVRSVLESPAMTLSMDVATIGPDLFHLTAEETRELLQLRGLDLDAGELHAATGGHPLLARAIMAVHDPKSPVPLAASVETAVSEFLDLSFAESRIGPEIEEFMIRTSIPASFTADLAGQLSGARNPTQILNDLESQGLGMWSRFGPTSRFRYGVAVRSRLLGRLKKMEPEVVRHLTSAVIRHDLEWGNIIDALRQAVDIGDLGLAGEIICNHHMTLLASRQPEVLDVLDSIPPSGLRGHPVLLMALALCYRHTPSGRFKAQELFRLATVFADACRPSMTPGQRIWMLTLESAALRLSGDLEAAVKCANLAVRTFEESPLAVRDELNVLEPTLLTQAACAHIHNQEFDLAADFLTQAVDAGRRTKSLSSVIFSTGLLAFTLAHAGKNSEALAHLAWLNEIRWPPGLLDGCLATGYRMAQVREAMDRQAYAEATGYLDMINDETLVSEFWPFIVVYRTYLDLFRTGPDAAPAALETRIRTANKAPLNSSGAIELDCLQSSIQLLAGHPVKASPYLRKYNKPDFRVLLMQARIALFLDEPIKTLTLTDRVRRDLPPRFELQRLLLGAAGLLRTGDAEGARIRAETAARMLKEHKLALTAVHLPADDMAPLMDMIRTVEPGILLPIHVSKDAVGKVSLTPRERIVLDALATYDSTAEIAKILKVSVNTVKSQRRSILKKLGAHTREEALILARRQGLLDD